MQTRGEQRTETAALEERSLSGDDVSHSGESLAASLQTYARCQMLQLQHGLQSMAARAVRLMHPPAEEPCHESESSVPDCDVNVQDDGGGSPSVSAAFAPQASQLLDGACFRPANTSPLDIVLGPPMLAPPTALPESAAAACQATAKQSADLPLTAALSLDAPGLFAVMEGGVWAPIGCKSEWLPRHWARMLEEHEDCFWKWSKSARDRIPMPTLELKRKSALRFHVQWHGISWPCLSRTPLERVLTDL